MILLAEKDSLRLGKIFSPPQEIQERIDVFLKDISDNLFAKWDFLYQKWEIWEHGNRGKDYKLYVCEEEEGSYREPDNRDLKIINDLDIQKAQGLGLFIEDELDLANARNEMNEDNKLSRHIHDSSMEQFDTIFNNPQTGGI